MVWGWFVQWPRASPSRTEFLHKLLVAKTGCFSDWSYVIYCLFCFRTILKFVPIICMLSSSQDQLSLAPGAPIREGTRIKLILTCRLWGLWLVLRLPPTPGPHPPRAAQDPASHRLCSVIVEEDGPCLQLESSDRWMKLREQLHRAWKHTCTVPCMNSHLYSEENVPNTLAFP